MKIPKGFRELRRREKVRDGDLVFSTLYLQWNRALNVGWMAGDYYHYIRKLSPVKRRGEAEARNGFRSNDFVGSKRERRATKELATRRVGSTKSGLAAVIRTLRSDLAMYKRFVRTASKAKEYSEKSVWRQGCAAFLRAINVCKRQAASAAPRGQRAGRANAKALPRRTDGVD